MCLTQLLSPQTYLKVLNNRKVFTILDFKHLARRELVSTISHQPHLILLNLFTLPAPYGVVFLFFWGVDKSVNYTSRIALLELSRLPWIYGILEWSRVFSALPPSSSPLLPTYLLLPQRRLRGGVKLLPLCPVFWIYKTTKLSPKQAAEGTWFLSFFPTAFPSLFCAVTLWWGSEGTIPKYGALAFWIF